LQEKDFFFNTNIQFNMSGFYAKRDEVKREAEKADRESRPMLSRARAMVNVPKTADRVTKEMQERFEKAQQHKRLSAKYKKEVRSLRDEVKQASRNVENEPSTVVEKVLRACDQNEALEKELYEVFASRKMPALFQRWHDRIETLEAALVDEEEPPVSSELSTAADENQRQREEEWTREREGYLEEQAQLKTRVEELEKKNEEESRQRQAAEGQVNLLMQQINGLKGADRTARRSEEEKTKEYRERLHAEQLLKNVRGKLVSGEKREGELREQVKSEKDQRAQAVSLANELRSKLNDSLGAERELDEQVAALQERRKADAQSLSDGTSQIEAKRQKIKSLERTKEYNWSLAGSFWKDLRGTENALETLKERFEELSRSKALDRSLFEQECAKNEEALNAILQSRDESCSRAANARKETERLGRLVAGMTLGMQEMIKSRDGMCLRALEKEKKTAELEGQLKEMTQSRDDSWSRANEKDSRISELTDEVQQLIRSRDGCSTRAEKAEAEVGQLKIKVGDLVKQRDDNQARADRVEGTVRDREAQIGEMTTSRDGQSLRADVAERQVRLLREEIAGLSRGQVKQQARAAVAEVRISECEQEILALTTSGDNDRSRANDAEQKVRDQKEEIAELTASRNDYSARANAAERSAETQRAEISELTRSRDDSVARASRLNKMLWRLSSTAQNAEEGRNEARSRAEVAERQVEHQKKEISGLTQSRNGESLRAGMLTRMVVRLGVSSELLVRRVSENTSRADDATTEVEHLQSVLAAMAPGAQELNLAPFEGIVCKTAEWLQRVSGMDRGEVCDGAAVAMKMVRGGPISLTELIGAVRDLEGELAFLLAVVLAYVERRCGAGGLVLLRCLDLLQLHGQDIDEFLGGIGEQETELEAGLLQLLKGGRLEVQSNMSRCGQAVVLKVDGGVRFCWLDTVRVIRTGIKCVLEEKDGQSTPISLREANQLGAWFPDLIQGYGAFLDITG